MKSGVCKTKEKHNPLAAGFGENNFFLIRRFQKIFCLFFPFFIKKKLMKTNGNI